MKLNNIRMVRYVDTSYSELKNECDERGIKKYSGLRKTILMRMLMMHDRGSFCKLDTYYVFGMKK